MLSICPITLSCFYPGGCEAVSRETGVRPGREYWEALQVVSVSHSGRPAALQLSTYYRVAQIYRQNHNTCPNTGKLENTSRQSISCGFVVIFDQLKWLPWTKMIEGKKQLPTLVICHQSGRSLWVTLYCTSEWAGCQSYSGWWRAWPSQRWAGPVSPETY